ncbi:MAG: cation:proton antiporter subunit C [Oscillospiraceae bacterium]|nr:cation:proton antiporter subunit C [Oscillospiraceae bacterium]
MLGNIIELTAITVFFISFYGLITSRGVIKSIISIGIMEVSIVVFFLSFGYEKGIKPPIGQEIVNAADPLPQALVITAIIIGVALTAVNLTMLISLKREFNATEWDILKDRTHPEFNKNI